MHPSFVFLPIQMIPCLPTSPLSTSTLYVHVCVCVHTNVCVCVPINFIRSPTGARVRHCLQEHGYLTSGHCPCPSNSSSPFHDRLVAGNPTLVCKSCVGNHSWCTFKGPWPCYVWKTEFHNTIP